MNFSSLFNLQHNLAWRVLIVAGICGLFASTPHANAGFAQQAYIKASNTNPDDRFGLAVAISGDTLVVGAPWEMSKATGINGDQDDNTGNAVGAVYIFVRNGDTWTQQAYLKPAVSGDQDQFGIAVDISGDTIVVGATGESSDATGIDGDQNNDNSFFSGAAYVFVRNGETWTQQAYLKASNAEESDQFGNAVAIDGNTVVVGAAREDGAGTGINPDGNVNGANFAGAVYVFTRSGTSWSQQAYIKASNAQTQDNFGWSVDISGDTMAVGARAEDSNATGINGNENNHQMGVDSGAAYVFTRSGTSWSQQAYVKASNTSLGHSFGWDVAIDGNTLAVSSRLEDSGATGVNGDQNDHSAAGAGAVFVFSRSGTSWSQQAYVKASNTNSNDRFGVTLDLSGNALVVGASGEASSATGVNGDQVDNSQGLSGAAYVFVRSGSNWAQQDYIKASNTQLLDQFGEPVAIDGTTLVAGAATEASNATGIDGDQSNNSYQSSGAVYVFSDPALAVEFEINAGVNDAWVSEDAPFQGFFFTAFPVLKVFFLSWFTFDSVPPASGSAVFGAIDQRWITASGLFTGDTVTLTVELTSGGIFNGPVPMATQTPNYGTITITFVDCGEAILTYDFPSLGLSGQMTVTRVVPSNEALCIALGGT